jgi:hypothetical protein
VSGTSVLNFLLISDGTNFTWGAGGSGGTPAAMADAGSVGGVATNAVPEPATWLLTVLAALAVLAARRRHC